MKNFHWRKQEYTKEMYERPDCKFRVVLDMVEAEIKGQYKLC